MIAYPPSFWRHTIRVTPNAWPTDADMGAIPTPGTPVTITQANVQDIPTLTEKLHDRTEIHNADTATRIFAVFTGSDPGVQVQDKVEQLDANGNVILTLMALSVANTRGTFGVVWRFEAVEIR